MSRWFRFYDDVINDPKILKLPEGTRWAWVAILCIASKNNGELPSLDDIAFMLRATRKRTCTIIDALVAAELLDKTGNGYVPHNWDRRQFKQEDKGDGKKDSYVYFIGHDWSSPALKIGFSKNPWARITELQTAHHEKLSVLAAFRCKSHSEVDLHDVLTTYRRQGEWFALPEKICVAVRSSSERSATYEVLVADLREMLRSTTTETEQSQNTEQKKDAAIAAPVPDSDEVQFFRRGKQVCGDSAGGMLRKLLKAKGDNIPLARAAVEQASQKSDPREYIGAIIRGRGNSPEDLRARGEAW